MSPSPSDPPKHILILGSGVFGLSTALALTSRPSFASTKVTLVDQFAAHDSSSMEPDLSASSIDASRIIRADYASAPYARLAVEAQKHWRDESTDGWGGEGRYRQTGLLLTTEPGQQEYVRRSLTNMRALAEEGQIEEANGEKEIDRLMGGRGISVGVWGYLNRGSGWADAEAMVRWALSKLDREKVEVRKGFVRKLLLNKEDDLVTGALLDDGTEITADLTILATGAWSYINISAEEQRKLQDMPVILNMSARLFVPPPSGQLLKVARHGAGYRNPQKIASLLGSEKDVEVSIPETGIPVPAEGQNTFRRFLQQLFPPESDIHAISSRPFAKTRVCWYTDTPTGDYLIDYHPKYNKSLFIATGGSGHAFKFIPVLGERIVDKLEGCLEADLQSLWRWREETPGDEL